MKHFLLCITICISLISCNSTNSNELVVNAQQAKETKTTKYEWKSEVFRKLKDPCTWKNEHWGLENKYDEVTFAGYPEAVPLEDAVVFYNRYFFCAINYPDDEEKYVAPLRVEEVLASIRSQDCKKGSAEDKKTCNEAWKISETRMMPKGSFIDYSTGEERLRGYRAFTRQIWLSVYMDKNRRDLTTSNWFRHKIRETYRDSEKQ